MAGPIRIGGMASGMDTESIIKQLMQSKRLKVDAFGQRKTTIEWRQEAYQGVNKSIANFIVDARKKLGLTNYTYSGKLYPGSINKAEWAKKADTTGSAFSAKATAGAPDGEISVGVEKLAKSASITGKAVEVKPEDKVGQDTTLKLTVNGAEKTIELKAGDTIASAMTKIKNEAGVNMSFGKVGTDASGKDSFMTFMSTKKTGANESIQSEDASTKAFFEKIGIASDKLSTGVKGENSIVTVNGSKVENTSNEVSVNGVSLSLKETTEAGKEQKVTVRSDVDTMVNKIKEFVEDYNKLVGSIQGKIKEPVYKNYKPLTKEQRGALGETEVKLWDEKAKSGLLNNDVALKKTISQVRGGLYEKVEGAGGMYEIGITTGKYQDGAKLQIDEKKLRKALSEDPQKVLDTLFKAPEDMGNHKPGSPEAKAQRANTGVFVRVMDDMATGIAEISKRAGAGKDGDLLKSVRGNILSDVVLKGQTLLERDVRVINKRIDEENDRLSRYESALWKRFTAMEKAIKKIQGQSGWMAQQFGGK